MGPPVVICTPERHRLHPHKIDRGIGNYPLLTVITGLQINYGSGRKDDRSPHEAQQSVVLHEMIKGLFEHHEFCLKNGKFASI